MRMYIEGNGESATTTFLVPSKNSCIVCFGALQHTFQVPRRSRETLAKRLRDKIANVLMFSQESLDHCPCGTETFRIPALEVTNSGCSARKLPDLKKSILKCRLSKCFEVLGVSLPQNAHHQVDIRNMK